MRLRLAAMPLFVLAAGCATTSGPASPPAATAAPAAVPEAVSVFESATTRDRIIVAGQPTRADLETLTSRGITDVFNLRAPSEMATLGFDEGAELTRLGVGYANHPIDGAAAYTPELLAEFAAMVERSKGKVLLHCTVGGRASTVYAAYAMKYLGLSPDEAMQTLASINAWPLPLERLTGERLAVLRRDEFIKAGFE